jgi:hypothetical protein
MSGEEPPPPLPFGEALLEDVCTPEYWRRLCPMLSIHGPHLTSEAAAPLADVGHGGTSLLGELRTRMDDGYFVIRPGEVELGVDVSKVRDGEVCVVE